MRKLLSVGVVVAAVLAVVTPVVTNVGASAAPSTTVVLSFDEGWGNQLAAQTLLDAHGMKGTFYVNSGNINRGGFLSWKDLLALQADGHEIGGETLNYVNVNTAPDAQTQVCEDRARLLNHGLQAYDFAYPGGQFYETPAVLSMIQGCGYLSGRSQFGLYNPNVTDCPLNDGCGFPDTQPNPPADAFAIKAARNVDDTTTLADLESYVTRAENASGGLVPIVFHQICNNDCDTYSTSPTVLGDFLTWLEARAGSGTVVKTMHDVIGGTLAASPGTADTTAPVSVIFCDSAACSGPYNNTVSVNLGGQDEDLGSGLDAVYYTTDGSEPTLSSAMFTAPFSLSSDTTIKYAAYDNAGNREATNTQQVLVTDTIAPVTTVTCNGAACGSWYHGPVSVALAATDAGSGVSSIRYTTDGFDPTSGSPAYSTPLSISTDTTLKYRAVRRGQQRRGGAHAGAALRDARRRRLRLTCNGAACSAGWYRGAVSVALSGADTGGSGLAGIHYTLDNSTPTAAQPAVRRAAQPDGEQVGEVPGGRQRRQREQRHDDARAHRHDRPGRGDQAAGEQRQGGGHREDHGQGERREVGCRQDRLLDRRSPRHVGHQARAVAQLEHRQGEEGQAHLDGEGHRQGRQPHDQEHPRRPLGR